MRVCSYFNGFTLSKGVGCHVYQMSAFQGGGTSGSPPVAKDHPLRSPCASLRNGRDFKLSLVCCLDAFKRSQMEDCAQGDSSQLLPNIHGPADAVETPDLEDIPSQVGTAGMRDLMSQPWPGDTESWLGRAGQGGQCGICLHSPPPPVYMLDLGDCTREHPPPGTWWLFCRCLD